MVVDGKNTDIKNWRIRQHIYLEFRTYSSGVRPALRAAAFCMQNTVSIPSESIVIQINK